VELRRRTAHLHEALDSSRAARRLMAPDITVAAYAAVLRRLRRVTRPFEAALSPGTDFVRSSGYRVRTPDLERDLAWLGFSPERVGEADIPRCLVNSDAACAGSLHVMEGAVASLRALFDIFCREFTVDQDD